MDPYQRLNRVEIDEYNNEPVYLIDPRDDFKEENYQAILLPEKISKLTRQHLDDLDASLEEILKMECAREKIRNELPEFAWVQDLLHDSLEEAYGADGVPQSQVWKEGDKASGDSRYHGLPIAGFFGAVAYNIGCMTEPHKDVQDHPEGWCFVATFGDYDDGDTVLVEAGWEIKQKNLQVFGF
ncbi:hypothetical protein HDU96_000655, partial [Phlyctochytrium bullatum]